jgi:hypothetical protein
MAEEPRAPSRRLIMTGLSKGSGCAGLIMRIIQRLIRIINRAVVKRGFA